MRRTNHDYLSSSIPPHETEKTKKHEQEQKQHVVTPNDYLVPLNQNTQTMESSTNKYSITTTKYRYHPYRNSENDSFSPSNSMGFTNDENQYARTTIQSNNSQSIMMQSPSSITNSSSPPGRLLPNDNNVRNMQTTINQTLLEPSVQVEPHFDTSIFTMRNRHTNNNESGFFKSSTSLTGFGSPNDQSSPPFSLQPISDVTYRHTIKADSMTALHKETHHHPPTLIPLADYYKEQEYTKHQFNHPLTQNYSITPLNLLQDNRKSPSLNSAIPYSNSYANSGHELIDSLDNPEPVNPSSYLRPLKQVSSTNQASSSSISNNNEPTSSAIPFSDPIILDLSNIPSTFDESSNFNYSKTKRIKNFVNDGPWTPEEHNRLLLGLQHCGTNWKEISESYVKTRTRVQVHAYATKVLKIKSPNNSDQ